jgi:hypothetical protein
MNMNERLQRAQEHLQRAQEIMREVGLLEKWGEVGRPVLVGATAYELMHSPDIDLEVFTANPRVQDGFRVVGELAAHPRVTRAKFADHLQGPDQGLYWSMNYLAADGTEWKFDMWLLPEDHPGPLAAHLVEPMRAALTDEHRNAILAIKEAGLRKADGSPVASIFVYQAVIEGGVRSPEEFLQWQEREQPGGLTFWSPRG